MYVCMYVYDGREVMVVDLIHYVSRQGDFQSDYIFVPESIKKLIFNINDKL